jgi:hypothetical protein
VGLPTAILLWGYSVCVGALWILCTLAIVYGQATRLYGASHDWVRWQNILALAAGLLSASLLAVQHTCALCLRLRRLSGYGRRYGGGVLCRRWGSCRGWR